MFPLNKRKVGGYSFGQKTFYSAHHLGTDYSSSLGTKLFAPFYGTVTGVMTGIEGGKTIWYKPNNNDVVMRFMHLSEFKCKVGQKVKMGDLIALTGNTGKLTKAPHLHLDISKHSVQINNFSNFIDPEKYNWKEPKIDPIYTPLTPEPIKTEKPVETIVEPPAKPEIVLDKPTGQIIEMKQQDLGVIQKWVDSLIDKLINFFK